MSELRRRLERAPTFAFVLYASAAGFATYFCMYAFRKPFAAASYDGLTLFGSTLDLKTALVISQIAGYTLSKWIGVKVVSEVAPGRRAALLLGLIGAAELALLLFALLPPDLRIFAIFLNGLPLGMVWGVVVRYLEGRQTSELLLAGLSCSFIVASGIVKDIGRWVMSAHEVTEAWMPFVVGMLFALPFALSVFLLDRLPRPSAADEDSRVPRRSMTRADRAAFVKELFAGLAMLYVVYFFLTAYRDFRDNYGVEIFAELGYGDEPAIFTRTELPVAFGVLFCMGLLNLVKDNRRGLVATFGVMLLGATLMAGGTLALDAGMVSGATWMVLVGLGSYLIYVPYGSVLFDRLVASTGVIATAAFAITIADALGYTGSIGVQLYKDVFASESTRLEFFKQFTYAMAAGGAALMTVSCVYFVRREPRRHETS